MNPWLAAPVLSGRHVTLRPLAREDGPALVAAARDGGSDELFYTYAPGPETLEAWLDYSFRDIGHARAMVFTVLDAEGAVAGSTRFLRMNAKNRRVEIGGTYYAARVRRTGLNTEAKLLLLRHAFETLGCVCVQFRTDWFNRRSQAAIERLGAKRDGVLRAQRIMGDGRVRDTVVYSVLDHEWQGVRMNLETLLARHGERP